MASLRPQRKAGDVERREHVSHDLHGCFGHRHHPSGGRPSHHRGMTVNQHLVDAYNATLDGDEWGNVMSWFFATAHVLHHLDEVPEEWEYGHGLCLDYDPSDSEDFDEAELQYLMADDLVSVQDLIEFGNMLDSLRGTLVSEGKDY